MFCLICFLLGIKHPSYNIRVINHVTPYCNFKGNITDFIPESISTLSNPRLFFVLGTNLTHCTFTYFNVKSTIHRLGLMVTTSHHSLGMSIHTNQMSLGLRDKGDVKMEMVGVVFSMNSEEVQWVHVLQRNVVGVDSFFLSNLSLCHTQTRTHHWDYYQRLTIIAFWQ